MKKKLLIIVFGLSIIIIAFSGIKLNQSYSPLPTIYYDGEKKEFTYLNIENEDLFTDLKDIMPGDIKEQEILFKAGNVSKNTRVFLNITKDSNENLSEYIKVYIDDNEFVDSSENIEIGTFLENDEIRLKVVVDVPKEVGNEIQDLNYNLKCKILVQEENGDLIEIPNTYDNSNINIYIIMCVISIFGIIYSTYGLLKKRD